MDYFNDPDVNIDAPCNNPNAIKSASEVVRELLEGFRPNRPLLTNPATLQFMGRIEEKE